MSAAADEDGVRRGDDIRAAAASAAGSRIWTRVADADDKSDLLDDVEARTLLFVVEGAKEGSAMGAWNYPNRSDGRNEKFEWRETSMILNNIE